MTKCIRGFLLCLFAVLVTGCASLPGFGRTDYDRSSRWYGASYAEEEFEGLEPDVHRITPSLIEELSNSQYDPAAGFQRLPESVVTEPYRIGAGDLLGVVVYGHPDITNPAGLTQTFESSGRVVDADGEIFIPFAGALRVVGMTTSEARELVADQLRRVINEPQVDVRVLRFRSKKVYVTGDVDRPCTVWIEDIPLTIVDALRSCDSGVSGSTAVAESINSIRLLRDGRSFLINLSLLYQRGDGPVMLLDGDRLIIDNRLNRVFVIGEVETQMSVSISAGGMSLADAIAAAGGLDLENVDTSSIYVIRGVVDKEPTKDGKAKEVLLPVVYHLDARAVDALILADQFQLQPRDVVYAAPASLVNFNRALAQITPSIDALFRTSIIYDQLNNR